MCYVINTKPENKMTKITNIYPNQERAAAAIYTNWKNNKDKKIFLSAECQAGKTGAIDRLGYHILNELTKSMPNFNPFEPNGTFNVLFFGPADNELKKQTLRRFEESRIEYVKQNRQLIPFWKMLGLTTDSKNPPYFYPNLKDFSRMKNQINKIVNNGRFNIFIVDEGHLVAGKDGTFDQLAKECNIPICSEHRALNGNEICIIVSATPSPQFSDLDISDALKEWTIVHLESGEEYYGAADILDHKVNFDSNSIDRLSDSWKILGNNWAENDPIPPEFCRFVKEVVEPCQRNKDGYLILRLPNNTEYDKLRKLLSLHPVTKKMINKKELEVEKFDSLRSGRKIRELCSYYDDDEQMINGFIENSSDNLKICVIFGSYLQGKTFNDLSKVVGWFDAVTSDPTANETRWIQSIGRLFGYKHRLEFPVWSNREVVEKARDYWNFMLDVSNKKKTSGEIPSLTGTHVELTTQTSFFLKVKGFFKSQLDAENSLTPSQKQRGFQNISCQNYSSVDVAGDFNRNVSNQMHGKQFAIFDFTAPNIQFQNSWNQLNSKYRGMFVVVEHILKQQTIAINESSYAA